MSLFDSNLNWAWQRAAFPLGQGDQENTLAVNLLMKSQQPCPPVPLLGWKDFNHSGSFQYLGSSISDEKESFKNAILLSLFAYRYIWKILDNESHIDPCLHLFCEKCWLKIAFWFYVIELYPRDNLGFFIKVINLQRTRFLSTKAFGSKH